MKKLLSTLILAGLLCGTGTPGSACGPWFPRQYLESGGKRLLETPEFYFEIELKMLAREYPVPFRAVRDENPRERNTDQDLEDFDAALRSGSVRPQDIEAAQDAHSAARDFAKRLRQMPDAERATMPREVIDRVLKAAVPSEFADYHEGVIMDAWGSTDRAVAAWERLLARPENERRYRSVNAAFMLGAMGSVRNRDDALKWLAYTRELVQKGFPDPLGLAAATYRREAEWYRWRGDFRRAAECALQSISAGYPSREYFSESADTPEELAKLAEDTLLRRMYTSWLLCRETSWREDKPRDTKFTAWVAALEAAKVHEFPGAERVGWMFYDRGDYPAAKLWLGYAPAKSPEAAWLRGKLAAREGRREEAVRAYADAVRGWSRASGLDVEVTGIMRGTNVPWRTLAGEYGTVAIGAAEFRMALDAFLRGNHWEDAAYVAERLLTIEELRAFVAKRAWSPQWEQNPLPRGTDLEHQRLSGEIIQTRRLRWLLARRLARAGRFEEAAPLYPPDYRPAFEVYAQAMREGRNPKLPRSQRASALWTAALEARYHGIELLGTEVAPDWLVWAGAYQRDDPAPFRLGQVVVKFWENSETVKPIPVEVQAGAPEKERLKKNALKPDKRFQYRHHAAALTEEAVALLPDSDPEAVSILWEARSWLIPWDEPAAFRLERLAEVRARALAKAGARAGKYVFPARPKELPIDRVPMDR